MRAIGLNFNNTRFQFKSDTPLSTTTNALPKAQQNLRHGDSTIRIQVGTVDPDVVLDKALPGVVKIKMYSSGTYNGYCTGTVVEHYSDDSYSFISTAAHCVDPSDSLDRFVEFSGEEIPLYCSGKDSFFDNEYDISMVKDDVAICVTSTKLNSPLIPPCGFSETDLSLYSHFPAQLSGYGLTGEGGYCTESTSSEGLSSPKFFLNSTLISNEYDSLQIPISDTHLKFYTCKGDSGGAGLVVSTASGMCQLSITSGSEIWGWPSLTLQILQTPLNCETLNDVTTLLRSRAMTRRREGLKDYDPIPDGTELEPHDSVGCYRYLEPTSAPTAMPSLPFDRLIPSIQARNCSEFQLDLIQANCPSPSEDAMPASSYCISQGIFKNLMSGFEDVAISVDCDSVYSVQQERCEADQVILANYKLAQCFQLNPSDQVCEGAGYAQKVSDNEFKLYNNDSSYKHYILKSKSEIESDPTLSVDYLPEPVNSFIEYSYFLFEINTTLVAFCIDENGLLYQTDGVQAQVPYRYDPSEKMMIAQSSIEMPVCRDLNFIDKIDIFQPNSELSGDPSLSPSGSPISFSTISPTIAPTSFQITSHPTHRPTHLIMGVNDTFLPTASPTFFNQTLSNSVHSKIDGVTLYGVISGSAVLFLLLGYRFIRNFYWTPPMEEPAEDLEVR